MDNSNFLIALLWGIVGYAIGVTLALLLRYGRHDAPPVQPVVYQRDAVPDESFGCAGLAAVGLLLLAFVAYLVMNYG